MKKICQILLVLFILSIFIQILYLCMSTGHTLKYDIKEGKKHFLVEEKYQSRKKNSMDHYEITIDGIFSLQVYENLYKDSRLIQKIKYYKDDTYTCIYPIFKSKKIKRDVLCSDGKEQIYYHNIQNNKGLDAFVQSLSTYDGSLFQDQKDTDKKEGFLTVYTDNFPKNHTFVIQNYKGAYVVNKKDKIHVIDLYTHDVYDPKLSIMVGKYFVTPDYEDKYSFNTFYILDSTNSSIKEVHSAYDISYDTYIQGTYKNAVYLIDTDHKKQYKIDIKERSVSLIGDVSRGVQYYQNGKWVHKDMKEALSQKLLWDTGISKDDIYDRIEKVPGTSYTYLFKKEGENTVVYRQVEGSMPTYLFKVEEVKMIQYTKDFIYFANKNMMQYYSDGTGLRTFAKHSEFSFNKNLKFFAYAK